MNRDTIRSTEFVFTVALNVGVVASALVGVLPPRWAAVCAAVSQVGYSVSRGIAKSGKGRA